MIRRYNFKKITKQNKSPSLSSFFFFAIVISYLVSTLAKEASRPDFESEFLIGIPEVVQHDVGDRKLLDFGCVDLEDGFSVTFPQLQDKQTKMCQLASTVRVNTFNEY